MPHAKIHKYDAHDLVLAKTVQCNTEGVIAEASWHADEAKRAFEALSARSRRDDEEAAKVRKERDELL